MNCDRLQNLTLRKGERLHKIKRISVHTRQCVSEVAQVDVSDCRKQTPKLGAFHSLLLINPLNEG